MEVIKELYVILDNRPGALGDFSDVLAQNNINIDTIAVFGDSAKLIVSDVERAKRILDEYKYTAEIRDVIRVALENKPGELAYLTARIGHVGINIDYLYSSFQENAKKVDVILDVSDIETTLSLFR
ncbi:ACT domain-containing protein [candidate division KSB1 bacterium]|nr:ACT domain-containing protein [candidate division KSB1 bacterium]